MLPKLHSMRFNDWIEAERGRLTRVAEHFGVTPSAVSQWLSNGVPSDRMLAVRALTDGDVTLDEMLEPLPVAPEQGAAASGAVA